MDIRTIKKRYIKHRRNRALLFSLIVHGILVVGIGVWLLKPFVEIEEDHIVVDFVSPPERIFRPKKVVAPTERNTAAGTTTLQGPTQQLPTPPTPTPIEVRQELEPPPDITVANLPPSDDTNLADSSPDIDRGSSETENTHHGQDINRRNNGAGNGLGDFTQSDGTGQDAFNGKGVGDIIVTAGDGTENGFISRIEEDGGTVRGHISLIRLKHNMSDWWQDPTAIPSLIKWLREHVKTISADMKYRGGSLSLTDEDIMNAPIMIMTGHDQAMSASYQRLAERNSQTSGFTDEEQAALRKYILDHNGMLFFDYCGNGGNEKSFARLIETEFRTIFPEYPMETLEVRHEVFQCYFKLDRTPVGGSTFWGTNYKGGNKKWRYIKGISVPGKFGKDRLAIVFCPLDYLCSMETAEIDSRAPLASRRSSDVYRFMTNLFVYQMRQRVADE